MILPPDFEVRTVEAVRRMTDDIADCDHAQIEVVYSGSVPILRFVFVGHPKIPGKPTFGVCLISKSRSNPLAPGKLFEGDRLRRHVRERVETYLKANGVEITRKVMGYASL